MITEKKSRGVVRLGGCEPRVIEVIVKMQNKSPGGRSVGWVDVNQELLLKLLWKCKKKNNSRVCVCGVGGPANAIIKKIGKGGGGGKIGGRSVGWMWTKS